MIIRTSWLGLIGLAVALAQNPAGPGGPPPHFGRGGPGAFQGPRFLGAEAGRPGRVVTNAPFSADVTTESTQTLANGDHIKQTSAAHFSRDSQGRTRREQSLNGLRALAGNAAAVPKNVVFIDDPVAGVSYALDAANKTATKSLRPAHAGPGGRGRGGAWAQTTGGQAGSNRPFVARGRGGAGNANVKTESLGTQTIEGVQAQGTRTTLTIPAGQMGNEQPIQIVTERWYSPDLQANILVKRSDPRSGETVTSYTNISRVEPVPTSFQVPAEYQVRQVGRGVAAAGNSQ